MFAVRRFAARIPAARTQTALFHKTAPAFVQKGDAIPELEVLTEDSPGNKINLAKELKGKGIIIGTPGAFSMYLLSIPTDRFVSGYIICEPLANYFVI